MSRVPNAIYALRGSHGSGLAFVQSGGYSRSWQTVFALSAVPRSRDRAPVSLHKHPAPRCTDASASAAWRARGRWLGACPAVVDRVDLGWTAYVGESSDGRQPLPAMGPRGQAVVDQLLAQVTELEYCEHARRDFAFWIAGRPGMLLCDFYYQAAQVLAGDIRCAACGQPAGDPSKDAAVVARVAAWFGAHFYLCSSCAELDLHHTEHTA
jgi:hypothetical protein